MSIANVTPQSAIGKRYGEGYLFLSSSTSREFHLLHKAIGYSTYLITRRSASPGVRNVLLEAFLSDTRGGRLATDNHGRATLLLRAEHQNPIAVRARPPLTNLMLLMLHLYSAHGETRIQFRMHGVELERGRFLRGSRAWNIRSEDTKADDKTSRIATDQRLHITVISDCQFFNPQLLIQQPEQSS